MAMVALLITYAAGEEDATSRPDTPRPQLQQMKRIHEIMQKHYLRKDVTKPGEKTWVGDTCIAKMVAFVGEKQRGDRTSPEAFFDGRCFGGKDGCPSDNRAAPAAAMMLYTNWDPKGKEESRMFNAISKHQQVNYGWKLREDQKERERRESAQWSEQTMKQD